MTRSRLDLARGALLILGAIASCVLAAWAPMLDRADGRFILQPTDGWIVGSVPTILVGFVGLLLALGALAGIWALVADGRLRAAFGWCRHWAAKHPVLALILLVVLVASSIDVYELLYDPYGNKRGLFIYKLREDVQIGLYLLAALMGAAALSTLMPSIHWMGYGLSRLGLRLEVRGMQWRVVLGAVVLAVVLAAVMCAGALEGVPHFSDSLTYLMQGRMLTKGMLTMPAPPHVDLYQGSLFFVVNHYTDPATGQVIGDGTRFFGKYPIGWPAILGAFDAVRMSFAANAVLAGLAAVLTGAAARQVMSRRAATIAAALFALSPWVWFHGASMASHVASTVAALTFLWLYLRTVRLSMPVLTDEDPEPSQGGWPVGSALGAGLALGAAVLIRPFDAAMFALPAIGYTLWLLIRRPKRWFALGACIAIAASIGTSIYLFVNAQTTGHPLLTAYKLEARWDSDWAQTPIDYAGRLAFQWVELGEQFPGWGVSGLLVAAMGLFVAIGRSREGEHGGGRVWRTGVLLWLIASALFFVGTARFGFTRVWWGARWLLPAAPVLAMLAALVVDRAIELAGSVNGDAKARAAGQVAMLLLLSGIVVGFGRYVGQYWSHVQAPPHNVSAEVWHATHGMDDVVIGMPPAGKRAPFDARAGMVFMDVPFESNQVIFVRTVPGWQTKAKQMYPGRRLMTLVIDDNAPSGFVIEASEEEAADVAAGGPR